MARDAEFVCTLGPDTLIFRHLHAEEELGRLPTYRLQLMRPSDKDPVKAKDLLGTKASVKILLNDASFRIINGWITRFQQGGSVGRFDSYEVELSPWLWYLTLGADCRIFQDKTCVQIIEAVFGEYTNQNIEKKLTGTYRTRNFCVQYHESDFDFVSRLMEEEGIYYYFKHTEGQHKMVLCDDASGHSPIPGANLAWAPLQKDSHLREDVVESWRRDQSVRSLKYAHSDFDFETPTTDLKTEKSRTTTFPNPGDLEVRTWPGDYYDLTNAAKAGDHKKVGEQMAQARVDAFESGHIVVEAVTPFRSTAAGYTFKFKDHPDADDYLITRAIVEAEFGEYEAGGKKSAQGLSCRFFAVPKSIRFQPQPVIKRPLIHGPQTAVVVGPSGDELATDKYGRVKVHFAWDRVNAKDAATSSCWVRVSHPWASKQFGMIALPRIGDEVVVEFLDGNPDRPMVTGRVYNADNMPPYELPTHATVSGIKTRSSKGGAATNFNELRFEDDKGKEYVWLQAEKDFHRLVKNDHWDTVKNDSFTSIEKNESRKIGETLTLAVGTVTTAKLDGDVHAKLGADFNLAVTGATSVKVTDKIAMKGDAAMALSVGAGFDLDVTAATKISAGATLHIKGLGVVIDGGTQLCIKAGGAFVLLGPEGVTIQGTMVKINSGGAAGTANAAEAASPTAPKDPTDPKENTDPIA